LRLPLLGVAVGAAAADMPKRKAGLWEMRNPLEGMPGGPPRQGMTENHMTQEARWLGPGQPGQKRGDVTMSAKGVTGVAT